jgi:hypothetical protein
MDESTDYSLYLSPPLTIDEIEKHNRALPNTLSLLTIAPHECLNKVVSSCCGDPELIDDVFSALAICVFTAIHALERYKRNAREGDSIAVADSIEKSAIAYIRYA